MYKEKSNIIPIIILLFFACTFKKSNDFKESIIGEWAFSRIEYKQTNKDTDFIPPSINFYESGSGYIFSENDSCENRLGYFKKITTSNIKNSGLIYLGNNTTYKIEKDSLKIFNISSSSWDSRKIYSIIEDTLTFQAGEGIFIKYAKITQKPKTTLEFDKIIVSSSGCYGTCPISDISIDKNGNVSFYGERYNSKNGFFTSKITTDDFQKISRDFQSFDIKKLKTYYKANWTDDETIYVTFISKNKIVKSIADYGSKTPNQFIWAYIPIRYLYQKLKLTPSKKPILSLYNIHFETSKKVCTLTKSESFFLSTEISKAKETFKLFQKKYAIKYWDDNTLVYTDGRFFQFKNKTLDLGYNFLDNNNLKQKFKEKDIIE